jgi:hypothetical protein
MKAKFLLFVLAFICLATTAVIGQSVVITPSATAPKTTVIAKGRSITFSVDQYGFSTCNNSYRYVWEMKNSSNTRVGLPLTYSSQLNTPSFYFPNTGVFTITVTVTQNPNSPTSTCPSVTRTATSTITVQNTVPAPNIFAATTYGSMISAFSIDDFGVVTSGPYNYFDPFPSNTNEKITAAMGRDKAGNFYYLPTLTNTSNQGKVEVWVMDGDLDENPFIAATYDLNGASNANVGLFRLGINSKGEGWILAGDNTKIYLAKFNATGKKASPLQIVDDNVTLPAGITPANFESGDLAFSKDGTMYALAGSSRGTYIFTMQNQNTSNATLVTNWILKTEAGTNFTTSVTGTVLDDNGSMYFSALDGIYFVDHNTINSLGYGSVKTKKLWTGSYLTDLATNQFPDKVLPPQIVTLPIVLEHINAVANGGANKLTWKTSMESNIQGFRIQRSYNGLDFSDVAFVFASGSSSSYQYSDKMMTTIGAVYYRLQVVEANGYTYSPTVSILSSVKQSAITMGPNPFSAHIQLTINSSKEEAIQYILTETDGRLLHRGNIEVSKGTNNVFINNLSTLKKGMYLLQIAGSEGSSSFKVIKN